MAYEIVAISMILSDFHGSFSYWKPFQHDFFIQLCSVDNITTVIARFLCYTLASCRQGNKKLFFRQRNVSEFSMKIANKLGRCLAIITASAVGKTTHTPTSHLAGDVY